MKITIDITEDETKVNTKIETNLDGVTLHQLAVAATILGLPGTDKLDTLKDAAKAREELLGRIAKTGILLSLKDMVEQAVKEQKKLDGENAGTDEESKADEQTDDGGDGETIVAEENK